MKYYYYYLTKNILPPVLIKLKRTEKNYFSFFIFLYLFLTYFIDYAITVVPFPSFIPIWPAHPLPPTFSPLSSCPWIICISSWASTFPVLFLTSPCLFSTYHLYFLFPVHFPLSPPPTEKIIYLIFHSQSFT